MGHFVGFAQCAIFGFVLWDILRAKHFGMGLYGDLWSFTHF